MTERCRCERALQPLAIVREFAGDVARAKSAGQKCNPLWDRGGTSVVTVALTQLDSRPELSRTRMHRNAHYNTHVSAHSCVRPPLPAPRRRQIDGPVPAAAAAIIPLCSAFTISGSILENCASEKFPTILSLLSFDHFAR